MKKSLGARNYLFTNEVYYDVVFYTHHTLDA